MILMRLIEIIGILLFYLFLFGGCAAIAITITPTTLIAMIIIGALFILRPAMRLLWRIFAGLHLLVYFYGAGMLLFAWASTIYNEHPGVEDGPETITPLILRWLITPILAGVALLLSAFNMERVGLRFLCVVLQALAVIAAWAYIINLIDVLQNNRP